MSEPTQFISPYCISAFIIHKSQEGSQYLLIRRCGKYLNGTWQMVTGGIHKGETAPQTALREIQEETGLIPDRLYSADAVETFYMSSQDQIVHVPVFVALVDQRMPITLSPSEHDAYEWVSFEEAKKRLEWSEQKRILEHVHKEFVLKNPNEINRIDMAKIDEISNEIAPQSNFEKISRTGVYGVAMQEDKMLLIKQKKGPYAGRFDLPGGGIEFYETVEQALRREFLEEVSMTFDSMQWMDCLTSTATFPSTKKQGSQMIFNRIGLIYKVNGLQSHQMDAHPEALQFTWMDPTQLSEENTSHFLWQMIASKCQV